MEDLPAVLRWALARGPRRRGWAIAGIFLVGGALLAVSAHAAVESMLALFVFWLVQIAAPSTRGPMIGVYAGWCGVEIALIALGKRNPRAIRAAWNTMRRR